MWKELEDGEKQVGQNALRYLLMFMTCKKYTDLAENDKARYKTEKAADTAAMIERGEDPNQKEKPDDEIQEGECMLPLGYIPPPLVNLNICPHPARVKKIVKLDPGVKNVSKEGMLLISKATVRVLCIQIA